VSRVLRRVRRFFGYGSGRHALGYVPEPWVSPRLTAETAPFPMLGYRHPNEETL
jgi:hypothetical protein